MKLIFRADDLGFCDAVNCGIKKSIEDGVITCVGMMPNMPEARNGYEMVKDTNVEIGQHTNICLGKPLTNPSKISSLVQKNGDFYSSKEIRARKSDTIVLEEVEIEIQAQLDKFREITGKDPAYFEGHAVMSPNFFQGLKNVAKKNGLMYCDPVDPEWQKRYGAKCSAFIRLNEKGLYDPYRFLFEDEAKIQENECSVLVFHPGYIDQFLLDNSSYTLIRPMETEFLCSERLKKWIQENDVELLSFGQRVKEFRRKD